MSDISFDGLAAALVAVGLLALAILVGMGAAIFGIVRSRRRQLPFRATGALAPLVGLIAPITVGIAVLVGSETGDLQTKERLDNTALGWLGGALIAFAAITYICRRWLQRASQLTLLLVAFSGCGVSVDKVAECTATCQEYAACTNLLIDCESLCIDNAATVNRRDYEYCDVCLDGNCPPIKTCDDACRAVIPL